VPRKPPTKLGFKIMYCGLILVNNCSFPAYQIRQSTLRLTQQEKDWFAQLCHPVSMIFCIGCSILCNLNSDSCLIY
jgi:hypothetical protein